MGLGRFVKNCPIMFIYYFHFPIFFDNSGHFDLFSNIELNDDVKEHSFINSRLKTDPLDIIFQIIFLRTFMVLRSAVVPRKNQTSQTNMKKHS